MMEHALFIRGLLDPTECELLETADMFAGDYCRLLEEAEKRDARTRDNPKEQTVGIGESKRYLWETDRESGFWGGFRVLKQSVRCRCREMCGRIFKGRR